MSPRRHGARPGYTFAAAQEPPVDPYANLGVYERVAFFVNPTAGSPVGGAKEIVLGAASAGVTLASVNTGDFGFWGDWLGHTIAITFSRWARCDSYVRCDSLTNGKHNIANIESPEMVGGFCTPADAVRIVGEEGAIITEGSAPHSPEWALIEMPVFLEIDPTVPKIRDDLNRVGIKGLVEYAQTLGMAVPVPCFFIVVNDMWDGDQRTFHTYWEWLRELWAGPFALYPAEAVPDWSVIR